VETQPSLDQLHTETRNVTTHNSYPGK